MEEIDVSCDEDSISLADTLPPNLPSGWIFFYNLVVMSMVVGIW